MKHNKLSATIAIPVLLFLISYFQHRAFNTPGTSISENAEYLEVPDYIYTAEYRMIVEKTFLDLYNTPITDSMHTEIATWLGYCNQDAVAGVCSLFSTSEINCGDKIRWGGKTFCISW